MNFSYLDWIIDSMPERGFPSCDFAVTLHGEQIYRRRVGMEKAVSGKPLDDKTLWWIYSASKISTCTAAMQLVEQGKLDPDDPVSKYLPAYANLKVESPDGPKPCKTPMKIIHLFTMTGGLDYDRSEPAVEEAFSAGADTVTVASAMAQKTLKFEPGEHFLYSYCHDVLGAVVAKIADMPLSEYLRRNLWLPLGMTDTGFTPNAEQSARFADMYTFDSLNGTSEPMECPVRAYDNPNYDSGGGGVFSSTGDYIKLMTALALGGVSAEGHRILKPETVQMMEVNRLSDDCRKDLWDRLCGFGWGLCGRVHMNPAYSMSRSSVGEFGWDGAAAAFALADRCKGVAMYLGTHVRNCNYCYRWLHPRLRDAVYAAIED